MAFADWTGRPVSLHARMFLPVASARIDSEMHTGNKELKPNTILNLPSGYDDLFATYEYDKRVGGGASGAYVALLRVKGVKHLKALGDNKPAFERLKMDLVGGDPVFIKLYATAVDDHDGIGDERPFREVHTLVTMSGISGYSHVLDYGIINTSAVSRMFGKDPSQHEPLEHPPKRMLFVVMTHPLLEAQIDRIVPGEGSDLQHAFAPHMARKKATMLGIALGIAAAYSRASRAIPGFRHNDLHPGNVIVDLTRTNGELTNPRRVPWKLNSVVNLLGAADMQYLSWLNPLSRELQKALGAAGGDIEWPRCGLIDFDLVGSAKWSWQVGEQRVKKTQTMSERLIQWIMHWLPVSCVFQWKNLLETLDIFQHGNHANDTRHIFTYFMIGIVDFLHSEGVETTKAYAIAHAAFTHYAQRKAVFDIQFATAVGLSVFSLSLSFSNWLFTTAATTVLSTSRAVSATITFFEDVNTTFKHVVGIPDMKYSGLTTPVFTLAGKLQFNQKPKALERQRAVLVRLAEKFLASEKYYPGTDELVGQFKIRWEEVKYLTENYILRRIRDVFGVGRQAMSMDASEFVAEVAFVNKKLKLSVKGNIKINVGTTGWMKLKSITLVQTEDYFRVAIKLVTPNAMFDWEKAKLNTAGGIFRNRNTTQGRILLTLSRHAEIFQLYDLDNQLDLLGFLMRPVATTTALPAWRVESTAFMLRGPTKMYSVGDEELVAEKSFLSSFVESWFP